MTEMYVIWVSLGGISCGYLGDEAVLEEDNFQVKYTGQVDINEGTIAVFSKRRADDIKDQVIRLVQKVHTEHADKFSSDVNKVQLSNKDVQTLLNKGYTFKCER